MNIVAKLIVGREERELTWVDLDYYRRVNFNGKPQSSILGGYIAMRFQPQTNDDFFLEWMFADRMKQTDIDPRFRYYKTKDGAVVFYENDFDGRILYKYEFEEGVPIHYRESFSNDWGMETLMVISAPIQKFRSKEPFIKLWYEKWTPPKEKEKIVEDDKPKIIECYYTDINGKRIEKGRIGQEIFLIVGGINLKGNEANLDLEDNKIDFEYNGELLINDVLKGHIFKNDKKEYIKLKVVESKNKNLWQE